MPLPPRVRRSISVLGAATGLVGAFAAGAAVTGDDDLQGRVDPIAFSGDSITLAASCDDLLEWYVARGVRRVGPWGWDTYDYGRRPRFRPVRPRRGLSRLRRRGRARRCPPGE